MATIALIGTKGGISKSTLAICLASEALERGARVLLVDADRQGSARMFGELADRAGHRAPAIVAMGPTMHRRDQLPTVSKNFDLVFIDTPGQDSAVTRSALLVADLALLPADASQADVSALAQTQAIMAEAEPLRDEDGPALKKALVITRKLPRTVLGQSTRAVLAATGLPVLLAEMAYRTAYKEFLASGLGVTRYAPRDDAAKEIRALLDEILALLGDAPHGKEAPPARRRAPAPRKSPGRSGAAARSVPRKS